MRPPIPSFILSRRVKIALAVVGTVIVLLILASSLVGVYINWLWYGEVGYRGVYRSMIETRAVLLLIFGVMMALIIGANLVVAYILRPPFRPLSAEQQNLERYRVLVEPRRRLILAIVMVIAFLAAGLSAQSDWRTWLLWRFGGSFGVADPQFHRDVSFFAWDYPVYRLLLGFGFTAVIFSLILSIAVHYLFGAIRLQTPGPKITLSARRHVTVLVFVFIVLKAVAYWLDRYGLVFSERGKVTGASYTDVNASLPAKTILFWIAVIIAAGVLASMWLRSAQLPAIGFGVLLVISILINGIYPAVVQQFTVKPNASDKEAPYISRNISATRQAYGVQDVSVQPYPVTNTPSYSALTQEPNPTVTNIRILDPNVVSPTFTQQQQLRNVYGFPAKLDVDRYMIDAVTRDYIVGVRELNAANLQGSQTNWINQHTVYTHGYGFAAAQANQDVTATDAYTEGDIPPLGPLPQNPPQVYYGELLPDYSIVGAQGSPREFDGNGASKIRYQGKGGIKLSNIFTRLAFAVKYKETNFLLNDAVSANGAKIMYVRDPRERVQKAAPFLQIDGDPYPVVVDGRIQWIVDGYTTMSKYPYSEENSLADLTTNTLSTLNRTASQPNSRINYIRNSVKATVDAYDGTVTLYQWDDTDPILKAWMKAFPGLVQPKSAMPAGILQHVRYPEDMFEVQRSVLEQYHLLPGDAVKFYNQSDKWTVPDDPNSDTTVNQPPYYVLADSPSNRNTTEFQLTTPMKVNNRQNLASFITVSCDQGSYGKMTIYQLPTNSVIQGPKQIANSFKTTAVISKDISLLDQGGSNVIHGNLLTLPIGNSFLYVEPLYVSGSSSSGYPVLRRILVAYGDNIGYSDSLSGALANLAPGQTPGQELGTVPTTPPSSSTSPPSSAPSSTAPSTVPKTTTPTGTASVEVILAQLDAASQRLINAYKTGDPIQVGEAEAQVKKLTEEYLAARGKAVPSSPTPSHS
jgi:uncharacterized protein